MIRKAILPFALVVFFSTSVFPQEQAPVLSDVKPKPLTERLSADDGAVAALLVGANLRGNLDLCDCNHPRGGLARRVGFVQTYQKQFPKVPILQVEAGFFWYNSEAQSAITFLQNDFVTQAYSRWPVDIINLGRYDLLYANRLLSKEGIDERRATLPMINNLISANGNFQTDVAAPAPYLIRDLTGPRFKGAKKKLRLGFLGLAEPINPGPGMRDGAVKNLFEAARKYVPELRKKCDVLIILSHTGEEASLKLATENPEADLVIAGNGEGFFKPRTVGNTLVVFAAPGNTQEGEVRLYQAADGKIRFTVHAHELDAGVPADPDALKFAEEARQALAKARNR